jgi:hypothetical protein
MNIDERLRRSTRPTRKWHYNPLPRTCLEAALGIIPSGGSALIDITVTPTVTGEITNYAADNAENQASATVTVG